MGGEHTVSTCELRGGLTHLDALRTPCARPPYEQMMYYLQESVAKLSAPYLEEAKRNSYA